MKRNIDLGLLVLRVGLSVMMLTHGIPKFMEFIGGNMSLVGDPIKLGGLITSILVLIGEVIAPVLILIGLKTRMATIPVADPRCVGRHEGGQHPGSGDFDHQHHHHLGAGVRHHGAVLGGVRIRF